MSAVTFPGAERLVRRGHELHLRNRLSAKTVLLIFTLPALVYVALFFAYPLYVDIRMSLENYGFVAILHGHGPYVGFANYRSVLDNSATHRAIVNTILFTIGSIVFQFVIGFAMAMYFNLGFRFSNFLRKLILIPWVMPLVAAGTMFQLVFATSNGLANQLLQDGGLIHSPIGWLTSGDLAVLSIIIINIWAGVPFNAVLLYSGLVDVPKGLLEAADVDGASKWGKFIHVTVPSMRGVILIVLMLGVVYTVKAFDLVMVVTQGGPANESQLLSSWSYTYAFTNFDFGSGAAVGNILLVFCLIVGVLYLWVSRDQNELGRAR